MALEGRLELKLSQKLILTPQLQMAIKLLQMPQLELSQALSQELVENPFLEESAEPGGSDEGGQDAGARDEAELSGPLASRDETEMPLDGLVGHASEDYFDERGSDGRDLGYFNPGNVEQPSFENFVSSTTDLFDHLLWQLRLSRESEDIRRTGEIIIGNLDENGYLGASLEELTESSGADRESVEKAIGLIQSFDPPGVCARDIKECLGLQINSLGLRDTLVAHIVNADLDMVAKKKYAQLAKQYNVSIEEISAAVKIIEGLDPKPGRNFSSQAVNFIVPDVYVVMTDEGYQIILNDEGLPRLRINGYYRKLLMNKASMEKEERQFLEEKLRSAVWLMKSLDQRNRTIYRVTESILNYQMEFFDRGVNYLKPLNLKDIASELSLHESTISRVTSNKYLSCSHGLYGFRYFFSNAIQSDSGELSSTSVKEMIRKIISEEDPEKPLSDMRIVDIFKSQNITIARRTIAKYRDELKIPAQSQRKR